jgi:hypothetical protein
VKRLLAGLLLVCAAEAQLPRIGDIEFYGLRRITARELLASADLSTGDPMPASRGELEGKIAAHAGVAAVQVQTDCCQGNHAVLLIGIAEDGEPTPTFRAAPDGNATLPASLLKTYRQFRGASLRADLDGAAEESLAAGHPLSSNSAIRQLQDSFLVYARTHFESLSHALSTSADPEMRQAAATILVYSPRKTLAAADLSAALQDPDEDVRAYAAHSLSAIAALGLKQPALGIRIAAAPFVDLLHSVALSDREAALKALLVLTSKKNTATLDLIRTQAFPNVLEMAILKTPRYAQPGFLLLGRVIGLPDAEVRESWDKGDRDVVIQKAVESAPKIAQ